MKDTSVEKQIAAFKNREKENEKKKQDKKESFGRRFEFSTIFYAILAGIVAVVCYSNGIGDHDLLWHTKLGEYIGTNYVLPTTDIFSWIGMEKSLPFTAHSWFFSLNVYNTSLFCNTVEQVGNVVVFCGAFLLFCTAKICLFQKRHSFFLIIAFLIGLLCFNPRPQVFSYSFLLLVIYLLTRNSEKEKYKWVYLLPVVACLWANVHGGTIPLFFCFTLLFCLLQILPNFSMGVFSNNNEGGYDGSKLLKKNAKDKKEFYKNWKEYATYTLKKPFLKSVVLVTLSFLGAYFNPYGLKIFIYGFVENNEITKQYVSEWQPILLKDASCLFVIGVILLYCIFFYKKGIQLKKLLPTLCCLCASAIHGRFIYYGMVTSLFLIAEVVNTVTKKKWNTNKWNLYTVVIVFVFSLLFTSFYQPVGNTITMDKETSTYLKEQTFERPYTCHNDGGKLIYEGVPTFIDQRFTDELMGEAIESQFLQLNGKTIEEYAKEYNFDAFIFYKPDNIPLEDYLRIWTEWKVGFENDDYVVFVPCNQE